MKSMLLAIRLKYFYLTYKGIKKIEVRKSAPKKFAGYVYEYVSKANFDKDLMEIPENEREFFKQFKGKIGLKFKLSGWNTDVIWMTTCGKWTYGGDLYPNLSRDSCLSDIELDKYFKPTKCGFSHPYGYAYHIEGLVIFDKPKELSEFRKTSTLSLKQLREFGLPYDEKTYKEMATKGKWFITKAPQSYCFIESEDNL